MGKKTSRCKFCGAAGWCRRCCWRLSRWHRALLVWLQLAACSPTILQGQGEIWLSMATNSSDCSQQDMLDALRSLAGFRLETDNEFVYSFLDKLLHAVAEL